jgi:hypothetical protein
MWRVDGVISLLFLVAPMLCAQQPQAKTPSVYTAVPGPKDRFVYVPGKIAMASEWQKARFDKPAAIILRQRCSGLDVVEFPKDADYIVFFSDEWKRNLVIMRSDGEVVWAGSKSWDDKSAADKACAEVRKDWKDHAPASNKPNQ